MVLRRKARVSQGRTFLKSLVRRHPLAPSKQA